MNKLPKIIILFFAAFDIYLIGKILLSGKNIQILNPKGYIALQERDLLYICVSLMLLVVIPVFLLAIHVATKYHEDNKKATYAPDWDHSTKLQIFLWAFPTLIILILCCIVWNSAHKLDPHNSLVNGKKPLTIQVVALRWKWLFIYPEQGIATVNSLVIPEKTPLSFELTASDTPMNSFWIPQLGGQIYAMAGMPTQTHMIADTTGIYRGSNAEINGDGFAGMTFTVKSVSQNDFGSWVGTVKQSPQTLSFNAFNSLNQPSKDVPPVYYSSTADNLYTTIVLKYMAHPPSSSEQTHSSDSMQNMPGMPPERNISHNDAGGMKKSSGS